MSLPYKIVNPLAFVEATSPHIASQEEGVFIDSYILSKGLRNIEKYGNWILVEGAGGWLTPLSETLYFEEWVIIERLPVIIVVGIKLGCINHALLTLRAVIRSGLPIAGWIANHIIPDTNRSFSYISTLKKAFNAPLLGEIPWISSPEKKALSEFIDLSLLLTKK